MQNGSQVYLNYLQILLLVNNFFFLTCVSFRYEFDKILEFKIVNKMPKKSSSVKLFGQIAKIAQEKIFYEVFCTFALINGQSKLAFYQ